MPQIIPIKDLKDTSNISDMCHKADEPIYVTKNGYGDMVLMSIDDIFCIDSDDVIVIGRKENIQDVHTLKDILK